MTKFRVAVTRTTSGALAAGAGVVTVQAAPALLVVTVALLGAASTAAAWSGRRQEDAATAIGAAVLALAWSAVVPAVWAEDPGVRSVALVAAALVAPALLHVVVSLDNARPEEKPARHAMVRTAYGVVTALALLFALSHDPFLDPGCVVQCAPVTPVLPWQELADATAKVLRGAAVVLGLLVVLCGLRAARRARSRTPLLVAAACGAVEVVWAVMPAAAVLGTLLTIRASASATLGAALLLVLLRRARHRAALRRMAQEIVAVTPPRTVLDVLTVRLGDPRIRLDFPLPDDGGWVDPDGRWVGRDPVANSIVLRRDGRVVARLSTADDHVDPHDVEEVLGPAILLAMDSERVGAELRLRLDQLARARREEVEASDRARRRAERDLHDGVQHLLLAATLALQDGERAARDQGDEHRAAGLATAAEEVRGATAELRRVAHGMYPVMLGDAGLVPALEGLALSSPAPITVDASAVPRFRAPLELTVYAAVAQAVRAATDAPLRVDLSHDTSELRLTVEGAALDDTASASISDRVVALGGTMETVDASLTMVLPCG